MMVSLVKNDNVIFLVRITGNLALPRNNEIPFEQSTQTELLLDDLGNKLLANLEESNELNQTAKELNDLKLQNEAAFSLKVKELESSYSNIDLFTKLSREVVSLKKVMENNAAIESEVKENLQKNLQEKKGIQKRILQVIYQNSQNNQEDLAYRQTLEKNLQMLTFEKVYLWNQNVEIYKEAQNLVQQKQEKDNKIQALEKHILEMHEKLAEKVSK